MIDVVEIPLQLHLSGVELRMVLMQPYIELEHPLREPFRWKAASVAAQIEALTTTLRLSREFGRHDRTHFTVCPEYSLPGRSGIATVDAAFRDASWPSSTVLIAGIDGLKKDEFVDLWSASDGPRSHDFSPACLRDHEWLNCCMVWVKEDSGVVRNFIQPKIRPAWPEMNTSAQNMFSGRWVYLFRGRYNKEEFPCNFMALTCFDWVATQAGDSIPAEILDLLSRRWQGNPHPIHWLFVPQHNEKPNHGSFLESTRWFLDNSHHPTVDREHACVVMANSAVRRTPCGGGVGGFSACIFGPGAPFDCNVCRPTVCTETAALRNSTTLDRYKDVVFREMGQCVHAFTVRVPRFVRRDPTDHTVPIPDAWACRLSAADDPRLPNGPVPAVVKWANDRLDDLASIADGPMSGRPLEARARDAQTGVVRQMRHLASDSWMRRMRLSTGNNSGSRDDGDLTDHVDKWSQPECQAMTAQAYGLSLMGLCSPVVVESPNFHGILSDSEGSPIGIVVVRGPSYEACRRHFDRRFQAMGPEPVVLIVETDSPDEPFKEEMRSILDLQEGSTRVRARAMVTLRRECRTATSEQQLKEMLDDLLEAGNASII